MWANNRVPVTQNYSVKTLKTLTLTHNSEMNCTACEIYLKVFIKYFNFMLLIPKKEEILLKDKDQQSIIIISVCQAY